ncbi:MAG: hypothetical protein QXH07_04255 [Thermoplasmata archaeon]
MKKDKKILVAAWLCKKHEKLAYEVVGSANINSQMCEIHECYNYAHSLCLLRVIK